MWFVSTYHKPSNTLRQMLVHPKDKNKKEQQCGVVYEITCEEEKYVGKTARTLETRLKQHTTTNGQVTSAIAEQMKDSGHMIKMDNVRVLERGNNNHRRKIKEAIQIYKRQPAPSRDQGMEIPAITLKLRILSCGPTGSHSMSGVIPHNIPLKMAARCSPKIREQFCFHFKTQ